MFRTSSVLVGCLLLAGCGFSIPIKPLASDDIVTGSITPAVPEKPFGQELTEEDWRRARSAMAVALDPLGNGERTAWDNPDTGRSGAFSSAGLPFVRGGEVCRAWSAELRANNAVRNKVGTACRAPGDDWRLAANMRLASSKQAED